MIALAALAALTLVGLTISLSRVARLRGRSPPVAAAAVPGVAVLPFRTVGADPGLWHEGIVDLLSYNLDGLGQLRKIDPVTVLTGWRRMGGSASKALTADDAREVGRRLGSRYVVIGRAVQIGADVQLIAEVHDVETGQMRGAVRVTRPADSASSLVDGLTLELLRQNLLPTDGGYPAPNLSRATTGSLPALKAYLAGERERRTAHYSDAVRHYHRAIEADSNFASAWLRLSSTCGWGACSQRSSEAFFRRALDLADQLPDRDAKLIRATSTNDIEAMEGLVATYPDHVEAWLALAEGYFHHIGVNLRPAEAYRGGFSRAVQLHPYNAEAYEHLIEDAFLRLDSLDAQRFIDGYVTLGGNQTCRFQVGYDFVWGSAAARERAMAVLDTVALTNCVQAPLAAPPHVLDRMAQIYAAVADTATRARLESLRSGACFRFASRTARSRRPDARWPGWPPDPYPTRVLRDGRSNCTSRGSPTRPRLGVPRECSPPRERRRTTSGSERSPSAMVAGPRPRLCGELSSDRPRASRRTVHPREPMPARTRRRWEPTRSSPEAIADGWRNSNRRWLGFPCSALTSNSRSSTSASGLASCCSKMGGRATRSGISGASTRMSFSPPLRPNCTLAGSPKPADVLRKR